MQRKNEEKQAKPSEFVEEDFCCPLTLEPFKAATKVDCGHLFDLSSVQKIMDKAKVDECDPLCPLCRRKIETLTPDVAHQALSDAFFTKKSAVELAPQKAHLSMRFLSILLQSSSEDDERQLKDYVRNLATSGEINTISAAENYEGMSPVTLLCMNKEGRSLLLNDEKIVSAINSEGLNAIALTGVGKCGSSAVTWLSFTAEGRAILRKYHTLLDKITVEGFNAFFIDGQLKGLSAASGLICSDGSGAGYDLLKSLLYLIESSSLTREISFAGSDSSFTMRGELGKYLHGQDILLFIDDILLNKEIESAAGASHRLFQPANTSSSSSNKRKSSDEDHDAARSKRVR